MSAGISENTSVFGLRRTHNKYVKICENWSSFLLFFWRLWLCPDVDLWQNSVMSSARAKFQRNSAFRWFQTSFYFSVSLRFHFLTFNENWLFCSPKFNKVKNWFVHRRIKFIIRAIHLDCACSAFCIFDFMLLIYCVWYLSGHGESLCVW